MSRRLVVALLLAAVAVAAGVAWLAFGRSGPPRPAAFAGEPTSAMYSPIDTRAADPRPLTVAEVFGQARVGSLVRGETAEFADCAEVLDGVSAPGCTQALRAVYGGGPVAGQFVVFNMPDGRAADALVAALGRDGFVRQAAPFDAARSRAQVRALGHYVTVSWIGPVSGSPDLSDPHVHLDGLAAKAIQARVVAAL
ncbi:hypothetical protein [Thermoactinospora rubra]|uniref:hypothetical protein n=1 Tax=Thermoactinospora rubra TaxID=1088767 RepID=UPI000A112D71|nr:hypothetical protein [Thermoactinospora rubra]